MAARLNLPATERPSATPVSPSLLAQGGAMSLNLVVGYVIFLVSRMPDIFPVPHSAQILGIPIAAFALLTGRLDRVFSSRVCRLLLLFTCWMIVGLPFSVWRGGTYNLIVSNWSRPLIVAFMVVAVVLTIEDCRKMMWGLGISTALVVMLSFVSGRLAGGRFALNSGTLQNSNDMAAFLLMGASFCLYCFWAARSRIFKVGMGFVVALALLRVIQTGSRAGLLTLLVLTILTFIRMPVHQKLIGSFLATITLIVGLGIANKKAVDRYRLLVSDDNTQLTKNQVSAIESTENRKMLLWKSIVYTLQHPLVGCGASNFPVAMHEEAEENNSYMPWRVTHNAFTQVSSETGLPGFFLYMGILVFCFRKLRAVRRVTGRRPELIGIDNMAFSLYLALIAFTITSIFASNAYAIYLPLLAVVTECFYRALAVEVPEVTQRVMGVQVTPRPVGVMPARRPVTP
jgi:O-antigen ligase